MVKPVPVWWNFEFWSPFNLSIYILECPLDCKEVKPVNPKGNQSWVYFGRTDAEAETPTLWPPDVKNWLIGKDPDARKDWGQEEKGETEDYIVGWHHWLNEITEQTQGDIEAQRSLECCSSCGRKSWTWLRDWTTTFLKLEILILHYYSFSTNKVSFHMVLFRKWCWICNC